MSLYLYGMASPWGSMDPMGLQASNENPWFYTRPARWAIARLQGAADAADLSGYGPVASVFRAGAAIADTAASASQNVASAIVGAADTLVNNPEAIPAAFDAEMKDVAEHAERAHGYVSPRTFTKTLISRLLGAYDIATMITGQDCVAQECVTDPLDRAGRGFQGLAKFFGFVGGTGAAATKTTSWAQKLANRGPRGTLAPSANRAPTVAGSDATASSANLADNVADAARLRNQLASQEIAGGHAFSKHVVKEGQFPGITTPQQFGAHIENIMNNPTAVRHLSGGRTAYWDNSSSTVVIRHPSTPDGGTAFKPTKGRAYFDNLR